MEARPDMKLILGIVIGAAAVYALVKVGVVS